jgi:hypothetical protein
MSDDMFGAVAHPIMCDLIMVAQLSLHRHKKQQQHLILLSRV